MSLVNYDPSVDSDGRVLYTPTTKSYKPTGQDIIGREVRIITCLNNSETTIIVDEEGRRKKILITRVYSLSTTKGLMGHASRFVLENVVPVYRAKDYEKVIRDKSKIPHAWLKGRVVSVLDNDDYPAHNRLVKQFSEQGKYLAYDPYKSDRFKLCNTNFLPSKESTERLPTFGLNNEPAKQIYCYESGILCL